MVGRETNPELVNRIANSPGVRDFVRPDGLPIDLTAVVTEPSTRTGCVILSNGEDAVMLFDLTATGVFQAHIAFQHSCRGKRGLSVARDMLDWMFERGAHVIWCDIPAWHKPAIWFARRVGFKRLPTSDADTEILEVRKTH